ncbi:MAG: hypothetical protein NTZ47_02460 [Bacteroidetes bacterium]|nr:hypothetical protein [Bacteroidota bacterium]
MEKLSGSGLLFLMILFFSQQLLLTSSLQIFGKRQLFYGKDSPAISIFALPIQQS